MTAEKPRLQLKEWAASKMRSTDFPAASCRSGTPRIDGEGARQNITSSYICIALRLIAAALVVAHPAVAAAGTSQPSMNEPAVDRFGLELKSGRTTLTTPVQISIGGDGEAALSIAYRYESTMLGLQGYRETGYPAVRYSQVALGGSEIYDYYSVEFGASSETFRRVTGGSGAFEREFNTDATLVQSGAHLIFTDKFGVQVTSDLGGGVKKILYPDGRQLSLESANYGSVYLISNNFGYSLRRYQSTVQAINRVVDYCDPATASLCTGLQGVRSSSFSDQSATQRNFTDAGGGVTRYRLISIAALDREPFCSVSSSYGGTLSCDTPPTASYYYPAGLTLSGWNTESVSITYADLNLPQPPYNLGSNASTHDDVRIASITKDGVTANYVYGKYPYGAYGQVNYNLPYRLAVTTTVNGSTDAYTMANKPNASWRISGRRFIEYAKDGLDRQTNFGFNDVKDLSSVTPPEGNSVQLTYDARYNVIERRVVPKPNSGEPTLVTTYTYPATCSAATQTTCNLPVSVTDPKGGATAFTYNSAGQVLTETRPPATAGSAQSVITNTYTWRTAYIKGPGGAVVAAGPAISLLTRSSTCRTQTTCAGTADEVVTTYDYGPSTGLNNLKLRGVGVTATSGAGQMQTLWTCYTYNYFGEKIAETSPNAGLAGCS